VYQNRPWCIVLCFAHYSIPHHSCLAITLSKFTYYHVCSSLQGCTLVDTHKICFIICFTIALQKCKYSLQIKDYNVGPILWKNYDCHDWFTVFCCATIILILWPGNEAMETGRYNMKLTTTTQVWIVLAIIIKHNSHMFSECLLFQNYASIMCQDLHQQWYIHKSSKRYASTWSDCAWP